MDTVTKLLNFQATSKNIELLAAKVSPKSHHKKECSTISHSGITDISTLQLNASLESSIHDIHLPP